jgi:hypothetical protein
MASGPTMDPIATMDPIEGGSVMANDVLVSKGCPVLSSGGSVEVYETFEVM